MKQELFIDVRTEAEWHEGHMDNAIHFELARLQQGQLPNLVKNTPIALYCLSGGRAEVASTLLRQRGFSHVRNAGGLTDVQNMSAAANTDARPIGNG